MRYQTNLDCRSLSRKLKDSEDRYQQTSSSFEHEHAELESRLEDVRPFLPHLHSL